MDFGFGNWILKGSIENKFLAVKNLFGYSILSSQYSEKTDEVFLGDHITFFFTFFDGHC